MNFAQRGRGGPGRGGPAFGRGHGCGGRSPFQGRGDHMLNTRQGGQGSNDNNDRLQC
jgi:hypothetical protein